MKQILGFILGALLLIGATFGITYGVMSSNNKKVDEDISTVSVSYFKDSYDEGTTNAIIRVVVFSDVKLVSCKYSIDNAEAKTFAIETGEADEHENYNGKGRYYLDTEIQVLDLSTVAVGDHFFQIKCFDEADNQYKVATLIFEIIEAEQVA